MLSWWLPPVCWEKPDLLLWVHRRGSRLPHLSGILCLLWFCQDVSRKPQPFLISIPLGWSTCPFRTLPLSPLAFSRSRFLIIPPSPLQSTPTVYLVVLFDNGTGEMITSESVLRYTNPFLSPVHPQPSLPSSPKQPKAWGPSPATSLLQWLLFLSKAQTKTLFLFISPLKLGSSADHLQTWIQVVVLE